MPGTIIRALRDAGANNPLLMIDEIDKMGADFRGDPSSAMLEVLDPEQNHSFRDHYLDLPFDLSNVTFVTTANTLDTIPGPLRDRMEVIQLAGYTEEEKLQIAKRYLVPRQIERNGLSRSRIAFSDAGAEDDPHRLHPRGGRPPARARDRRGVPEDRAPGGRGPRRPAGDDHRAACPRAAGQAQVLQRGAAPNRAPRRRHRAGVDAGGRRGAVHRGDGDARQGRATITGQLGDVMKESAQAALSYVRSNAYELVPELAEDWFATHDIHIHVPAGATPKDGPSAGVAMVTALASLLSWHRSAPTSR